MRIGILTMHKVINYGSALQAWATQKIISKLGHEAMIIDYIFPNSLHLVGKRRNYVHHILHSIMQILQCFPEKKKQKKFQEFWNKNFNLTKTYHNRISIQQNPPLFDIYIIGSDQVWNPKHIKNDTTFFLDFIPKDKRCFSYASSIAMKHLDTDFRLLMTRSLKRFQAISIREKDGINIVKEMTKQDVCVCLDPTLLLEKEDYETLIQQSCIKVQDPYILAYILDYAYNPYPYIIQFINEAQKRTNLDVVFIDLSIKRYYHSQYKKIYINNIGPNEFVYLFANADMVVTSSFHGTAFALNFGKSVYSIIDDTLNDNRIKNLLELFGAPERAIPKNSDLKSINISTDIQKDMIQNKFNTLRKHSIDFILKNLS